MSVPKRCASTVCFNGVLELVAAKKRRQLPLAQGTNEPADKEWTPVSELSNRAKVMNETERH
jgi:hypothetical protein